MDAKERLIKIQEYSGLSGRALAMRIGINENCFKSIRIGKVKNISHEIADAVVEKYNQINKMWILTGEGEMLVDSAPSAPKDEKATMLDLMTRLMASIERSQQQFDRMLAMHERIIYGKDDALEKYKKMAKDADDLADVDIKAS